MAIGDFTPKKLLQKALDITSTNSQITGAVNQRTTITSITVNIPTGSTKRTISVYAYGTAAANEIITIPLDPAVTKSQVITGLDYVLAATETMSFKQDVGTDVNIAVMGIEEEI